MPSRNTVKEFAVDQYYHVYNRGVEKRVIFLDNQDYVVFLGLLKKYLTGEQDNKTHRHKFDNLAGKVDLIAYCLMPNHFHLLFFQSSEDGITRLMRRVMTGYVMYFNNRYARVGVLFQGRYKASHIAADAYLHHISRYIHLNPDKYATWPYSSWLYYLGEKNAGWLKPKSVLDLFNNDVNAYRQFVEEYVDTQEELGLLKWQLADNSDIDV